MITLKTNIKRELSLTGYMHKGKIRPVILMLTTNETIIFKPKGCKHKIEIPLSHCMNLAEIFSTNERFNLAMKEFKEGKRKRKPKRKHYPYSKVYFNAIETLKQRI